MISLLRRQFWTTGIVVVEQVNLSFSFAPQAAFSY